MTLSHTLAWYEFRVVGISAAFAGIITLIHNLPRTWPGEQGVTDHQHLGLYLTTVVLNGFGVVAHSTGMKPKHWNVPFFYLARVLVYCCITTIQRVMVYTKICIKSVL